MAKLTTQEIGAIQEQMVFDSFVDYFTFFGKNPCPQCEAEEEGFCLKHEEIAQRAKEEVLRTL